MAITFIKAEPYYDMRWRIPWKAVDGLVQVNANTASFSRDKHTPPTQKDIDIVFAQIAIWVEDAIVEKVDEEQFASEKKTYYEKWAIDSDEELIKKCIEADANPDELDRSTVEAIK